MNENLKKRINKIHSSININNNIVKLTNKEDLRDIILSGKFDDSIQVKNTEHICKDGTIYNYSEITDMSRMFYYYSELVKEVPLFDTSNVTNMNQMFFGMHSATSIPLLDTSNVTNMNNMFRDCRKLTSIPLFDTTSVKYMFEMFKNCYHLKSIPIFSNKSLINCEDIFFSCYNLSKTKQIKFFYQKDKLLLKSLEQKPELFSEKKAIKLLNTKLIEQKI